MENKKNLIKHKVIVLPLTILLIGCFVTAFFGTNLYHSITSPKTYITLPGNTEIIINKAGSYEIYYEYNMAYLLDEDITFYFRHAASGETTSSYSAATGSNYSINGKKGKLVAQAKFTQTGKYTVTGNYSKTDPKLKFIIGHNVVLEPIFLFIVTIAVGLITFAGFAASLAIMLIKKKRNK